MIDEKRDLSFIIMARKDRASSFPNNNISDYILSFRSHQGHIRKSMTAVNIIGSWYYIGHVNLCCIIVYITIVFSSYHYYYSPFLFVQMHLPSSSNLFSPIPGKCVFFGGRRLISFKCSVFTPAILYSRDKNLKLIPRLFLYLCALFEISLTVALLSSIPSIEIHCCCSFYICVYINPIDINRRVSLGSITLGDR